VCEVACTEFILLHLAGVGISQPIGNSRRNAGILDQRHQEMEMTAKVDGEGIYLFPGSLERTSGIIVEDFPSKEYKRTKVDVPSKVVSGEEVLAEARHFLCPTPADILMADVSARIGKSRSSRRHKKPTRKQRRNKKERRQSGPA
jgi:hypothetical protein